MDRQKIAKKIAQNIKEIGSDSKQATIEKTVDLFGQEVEPIEAPSEDSSTAGKDLFGYDSVDRDKSNLPPVVTNSDSAQGDEPDLDSDLDQGADATLNSDPKYTGSGTGPKY